jgi:hypothetical protein
VNTFAKIIQVEGFTGKQVNYYTVHFENREHNEFKDFIVRHITKTEFEEQLNYLNKTLERFSRQGAKPHYFRHEGAFHALPPPARYLEFDLGNEQLRLYCLYVSKNIVFLFNGGIKTTQKAQDCESVSGYFAEAGRLTAKIDAMINDGEIEFDTNRTKIINHQNFELWLI